MRTRIFRILKSVRSRPKIVSPDNPEYRNKRDVFEKLQGHAREGSGPVRYRENGYDSKVKGGLTPQDRVIYKHYAKHSAKLPKCKHEIL